MNPEGSQTKGRRLGPALSHFAAMLIDEACDVSGLTIAQLADKWGLPYERVKRYSKYPGEKGKSRGVQVASVQWLENEVAKLLRRSAHKVVVKYRAGDLAAPTAGLNVREFHEHDLWLGYEDGWPTYGYLRLGYEDFWPAFGEVRAQAPAYKSIAVLVKQGADIDKWPHAMRPYAWQWGVLWDMGLPWLSRDGLGIQTSISVEAFLPGMTEMAKPTLAEGPPDGYFDFGPTEDDEVTTCAIDDSALTLGAMAWARWQEAGACCRNSAGIL